MGGKYWIGKTSNSHTGAAMILDDFRFWLHWDEYQSFLNENERKDHDYTNQESDEEESKTSSGNSSAIGRGENVFFPAFGLWPGGQGRAY
jgi:hypothetical protein